MNGFVFNEIFIRWNHRSHTRLWPWRKYSLYKFVPPFFHDKSFVFLLQSAWKMSFLLEEVNIKCFPSSAFLKFLEWILKWFDLLSSFDEFLFFGMFETFISARQDCSLSNQVAKVQWWLNQQINSGSPIEGRLKDANWTRCDECRWY